MNFFTIKQVTTFLLVVTIGLVTTVKVNGQQHKIQPAWELRDAFRNKYSAASKSQLRTKEGGILCSPDSIVLHSQAEVDNFPVDHAGCTSLRKLRIDPTSTGGTISNIDSLKYITEIASDLELSHTAVTNLSALSNLTYVGGWIWIDHDATIASLSIYNVTHLGYLVLDSVPNLTSLAGISSSLVDHNMGTIIISNTGLSDLSGLEGIESLPNIYISVNQNLQNCQGLQNLQSCDYGISVFANPVLTDLSAFNQITSIREATLEVSYNYQLPDLSGFKNITQIGRGLWLEGNAALTTLNDLNPALVIENNINDNNEYDNVRVTYNYQLSACSNGPLCAYLIAGGVAEIHDNAPGCSTAGEILANCSTCASVTLKTWTGNVSNDWNDENNWEPIGVPVRCDSIFIPGTVSGYPFLSNYVTIHALTMEQDAKLDLNYKDLQVEGDVNISGAELYNGVNLNILGSKNVNISNSSFYVSNVKIDSYIGPLTITSNYFDANLTIKDSDVRTAQNNIDDNYIYGDFTITTNATDVNATTSLSEYDGDYVYGKATFNVNAPVGFWVEYFNVSGDLAVKSDYAGYPYFNYLRFDVKFEGTDAHVTQLGSAPIKLNNPTINKYHGGNVILDQNVFVTNNFSFTNGLVKTEANKLLVFENGAGINQYGSSSYVWGPLKKIGNQQFNYPVGDGNFSTVCTLSTPSSSSDAFTVQYFHHDPNADGYDTSKHVSALKTISSKEYWTIVKDTAVLAGRTESVSPNVQVTLTYSIKQSDTARTKYDLRIARWDGSLWQNEGIGNVPGDAKEAYPTSAGAVSGYGVFTLGYVPTRIPVITVGLTDTIVCTNKLFRVPFSVDTLMFGNNNFRAELSDTAGSFKNPVNIGNINSNHSDTINTFLPYYLPEGRYYKIRVIGTNPPDTSINTITFKARTIPVEQIKIIGPTLGCVNTVPAKYYQAIKEDDAIYTWEIAGGGKIASTNRDTAFVTFTAPATTYLGVRTSNGCGNGQYSSIQITVSFPAPTVAPVINSTGRWLYASAPPAGQFTSGYKWYKDNLLINGVTGSSYYASAAGTYSVKYYTACGDGPASNTLTFGAASVPQTISFPAVTSKTYGDSSFAINASTSAGLPVFFTIVSGPGSLNGNFYTITTTGTVTIKAIQPGDNERDTATPVLQTFVVNKAAQTINFPAIADQLLGSSPLALTASASSTLPVSYSIVSGPASVSGNQLIIVGIGNITVRAAQGGDTNFLPAPAVSKTLCARVGELTSIAGPQYVCPGQTAVYTINKIAGLTYNWRSSTGTTYPSNADTASITWNTPGTYTLLVSATGPCGAPTANDSLVVNVITPVTPGAVTNMLPANGSVGQALPLTLSWIPGSNALTYDVYVWDSAIAQPSIPYAANLTGLSFTIPANAFIYNRAYKWTVVSKNACLQTAGPVQQFRLKPLPDLLVSNVQLPSSAFSGQTISISWRVNNIGPGSTTTNQSWTDAVFLAFDTLPNFSVPPNTSAVAWSILDYPVRPLLVGTKPNVTALDSGQQYTNSINFTLPLNYSQPLYAYVITNYPAGGNAPLQMTNNNDTARAPQPLLVTLAPTPDLRVDTVLTPASVFSGSTVNVTYKVKNYGVLTPSGGGWYDKFYISQSPLFNINSAVPVKLRRANDSYYPNAVDAEVTNILQLQADSSYTRNVEVVIPNFIFGNYFIYVLTNSNNSLYEGPLANNNVNRSAMQVFLTPTPQLTISSLSIPVTTASVTQPIGVNWNIFNAGFNDNIERNKGHYLLNGGTCLIYPDCPPIPNIVCPPIVGSRYRDSLGFGSSYWVDRVYLSTDSLGLNTANAIFVGEVGHGAPNSGLFVNDNAQPETCVVGGLSSVNTFNVIKQGSNHPGANGFAIPNYLQEGNYYVYVWTNATKTVFEYPGTAQIKRSNLPIIVQRPDLSVPSVTTPANAVGGQQVSIQYQVQNSGPGSVFNALRRDRIYISNSSVFDGTAQLLSTEVFTESVPAGSSVSHVYNYAFSQSTSGIKYFYVQTNYDSTFGENSYKNNISAAASISVSTASPNDLIVSTIQLADTVYSVLPNYFKYTVTNNGKGVTAGNWTDSIFISCNSTFNQSSIYYIGRRTQSKNVAEGESYSDSFNLAIPFAFDINNCFQQTTFSNAYFFIKTNADNVVFEGGNTGNNVTGSGYRVLVNPLVDHIVTSVTGPDTAIVARPYTTSWTVKNQGNNPGANYYDHWYDAIYFSLDSVFNSNAILATNYFENTRLSFNQTYSETKSAIPPKVVTGDYYVIAVTNHQNSINGEKVIINNTNVIRNASGAAKKIHVVQPLLPDLVDTITGAPALVAVGQPLTVAHTMKNIGSGASYPVNWSNDMWLSNDFIAGNAGDIRIWAKNYPGTLQPGQSVTDTITASIDINTPPGNYILISTIDGGNSIFESNDTNNVAFSYVTVYSPAPVDLLVEKVTKPDTVYLGYTIDTVKWVIQNIAANTARGICTDGVYLSNNNLLDSTAVLLGVVNKRIDIAPLNKETVAYNALVTNVVEGNYNVLVKTDLLNNIVETNKNNNTGIAAGSIYVKVKELTLNVPENNTLQSISRFYKLIIPDSLRGSTILVTLKTKDSLTVKNELYIGKGYVPSPSNFDYRFETANYGNQQIVMTSVEDSLYYVVARCASSNPPVQNITLKAVKLPFAILSVQSNSGGNTGNVTLKISGSLFTNNMTAQLNKAGTTIYASAVYFINSTSAYATFNLQGMPLGLYDVSLIKADSSIATLSNSFSIVQTNNGGLITGGGNNTGQNGSGNEPGCDPGTASGLNSQLVTQMVIPEKVFAGWPFVIQLNYSNPGNVDVPAQTRILYNDKGIPMSLVQSDVNNGKTSLYLELIEPGGPPGIIRAGGSGTITIYARSPLAIPGHTFIHFNLK